MKNFRDPEQRLVNLDNGNVGEDSFPYRDEVDSLIYLLIGTCPDNAFAVEKQSIFREKSLEKYWIAAKRLFRYIKNTKHLALRY